MVKDNPNANNPSGFSITCSNSVVIIGSNNYISNNALRKDIENKIEENEGEDKEEFKRILNEAKAACNI